MLGCFSTTTLLGAMSSEVGLLTSAVWWCGSTAVCSGDLTVGRVGWTAAPGLGVYHFIISGFPFSVEPLFTTWDKNRSSISQLRTLYINSVANNFRTYLVSYCFVSEGENEVVWITRVHLNTIQTTK